MNEPIDVLYELKDVYFALHGECMWLQELDPRFSRQEGRRQYIRSAYAWIEGTSYILRQACIAVDNHKQLLSPALRARLEGNWGSVTGPPLALIAFCVLFGVECPLDLQNPRWVGLLGESRRLRNRITHPNRLSELTVTDSELDGFLRGASYFEEVFEEMFVRMHAKLQADPGVQRVLELRQEMERLELELTELSVKIMILEAQEHGERWN